MIYLAIDTATDMTLVAIDHPLFRYRAKRNTADSVTYLIQALTDLNQCSEGQAVECVLVGIGPGSYTGMRIGLTAAKMWAYARKLPVIGVSSLFAFAPLSNSHLQTDLELGPDIAVVFDARGGGIYAMRGLKKHQESRLVWKRPEIVKWSQVPAFSKSLGAIYHPACQDIECKWMQFGGERVRWIAQEPSIEPMIEAVQTRGIRGNWSSQFREIELIYFN